MKSNSRSRAHKCVYVPLGCEQDMNVKFKKDQKTTATPYMLWYIELDDWRGFEVRQQFAF